ncbi:MAG: aldehyde dehydrogenase family protein [Actinomycetota bacterium]
MADNVLDRRNFYINGQWVAPAVANDLDVIDPSTEEVCAVISLGGQADTDAAVAAAKAAFPAWAATPVEDRIALLEELRQIYKARAGEMAETISMEMGAPMTLASTAQVGAGVGHIGSIIRALKAFEFDRPLDDRSPDNAILYEPVGVCAMITPWNWPMNQVTLKVAPAIGVGCTMVLKPSEVAPLSSALFSEMVHEAGFPAGVYNMVQGDGPGVGTQLSGHPDVDMVSFTGSTRAGTAITKNAADSVKRVALELGGKGANIIFADADEEAVGWGVWRCFNNTGQSCNAPTRMLVERSIYDQAVETARVVAEKTAVDVASNEGNHIGPAVSKAQWDKIQGLIAKGEEEGARLIVGGTGRPEGFDTGYFVRPTVFADVDPDMTIAREEIFGPVLSIMPFDTEEEAIAMANDTPYGLTNYVQTTDNEKARRVARQLRSGMVEMNRLPRGAGAPFGGYGQSGNGREGGAWGIEEFLEVKSVSGWNAVQ